MKGIQCQSPAAYCIASLLLLVAMQSCARQNVETELRASQYRFEYNEESYRIRSISSPSRAQAYNELVGKNFVAIDFDQDRLLDRILLGGVNLNEAQAIYDHGLVELAKENKLQVRTPTLKSYVHESNGLRIEIISFRPGQAQPFNEFKIIDRRPVACPQNAVLIDHEADGTLDEVLTGAMSAIELQPRYEEALAEGVRKGAMIKANGVILVKEQ
jgi:hypothetical protein